MELPPLPHSGGTPTGEPTNCTVQSRQTASPVFFTLLSAPETLPQAALQKRRSRDCPLRTALPSNVLHVRCKNNATKLLYWKVMRTSNRSSWTRFFFRWELLPSCSNSIFFICLNIKWKLSVLLNNSLISVCKPQFWQMVPGWLHWLIFTVRILYDCCHENHSRGLQGSQKSSHFKLYMRGPWLLQIFFGKWIPDLKAVMCSR